ncbi:hypothetical protein HYZ80_02275 [Candidatus Parcubacteria bacterium]|nr:hypothetical protein [Candidatus Parcubacteria bacterium]
MTDAELLQELPPAARAALRLFIRECCLSVQRTNQEAESAKKGQVFKRSGRGILGVTAAAFELQTGELTGKSRMRRTALARQVAMYLIRTELTWSYSAIGAMFGNRDHTTVLHACRKIAELADHDAPLNAALSRIKAALVESDLLERTLSENDMATAVDNAACQLRQATVE